MKAWRALHIMREGVATFPGRRLQPEYCNLLLYNCNLCKLRTVPNQIVVIFPRLFIDFLLTLFFLVKGESIAFSTACRDRVTDLKCLLLQGCCMPSILRRRSPGEQLYT